MRALAVAREADSVNRPALFLEEVFKRLAGICRAALRRLAFHHRACFEELAGISRLLVNDADGNWLPALKAGARIEEGALPARVQVGAALRTGAVGKNARLKRRSTRGTPRVLAERHHSGRARSFALNGFWPLRLLLVRSLVFHIAALAIFLMAHSRPS